MSSLAIVVYCSRHENLSFNEFFRLLAEPAFAQVSLELLLIGDAPGGFLAMSHRPDQARYKDAIHILDVEAPDRVAGWNAGMSETTAEWIVFCEQELPNFGDLIRAMPFLERHGERLGVIFPCDANNLNSSGKGIRTAGWVVESAALASGVHSMIVGNAPFLFRRDLLIASGVRFDPSVRAGFEAAQLTMNVIALYPERALGILPVDKSSLREPGYAIWRNKGSYATALIHGYLQPLERLLVAFGEVPIWIQRSILADLQWYFDVDLRERAPTVVVNEPMAEVFHELVKSILSHLSVDAIASLTNVKPMVQHALLSYKGVTCHSGVVVDAVDHDQGLMRLSYFVHGERPKEVFRLDGQAVTPAYAKYRACRFFRHTLLCQRLIWLLVDSQENIQVFLNDNSAQIGVTDGLFINEENPVPGQKLLVQARRAYPRGWSRYRHPLPGGLRGMKVRILRWLARNWLVRRKFQNAWVLLDRGMDADDSAEHLYRWIKQHHAEINAWYLLDRESIDWARLKDEGFRLAPQGLMRKLLLLNSDQIISSHAGYMQGGFDERLYGDLMEWRYTFLQHGVIKDDLSHWLSDQPFDLFVTTSPDEHASIVKDDTPYSYTEREICRTGLPRHDRLLNYAAEMPKDEINVVLVMPTWRGGLVDGRGDGCEHGDPIARFAQSDYARYWRAFLSDAKLHDMCERHGKKLVFMPHPNAVPYINGFELPTHVTVATSADTVIQKLFAKTAVFITDYTSVAFTMALLRRPVFYYQFDKESFYGGDHNWREGYFDYERDGFGPVVFDCQDLINEVGNCLARQCEVEPEYLAHMRDAMPETDAQSCRKVFERIRAVRRPFQCPSGF